MHAFVAYRKPPTCRACGVADGAVRGGRVVEVVERDGGPTCTACETRRAEHERVEAREIARRVPEVTP